MKVIGPARNQLVETKTEPKQWPHKSESFLHQIKTTIPPSCAVLLLGQSGSGKSTMKNVLRNICDWKCIDSDVLKRDDPQTYATDCVAVYENKQQQLSPAEATPDNLYTIEKRVKTEYQCVQIAKRLTHKDKNWLFDTRGNKREVIATFLTQAHEVGLPVIIIHMQVKLETAIARTTLRAANAAEGNAKKGKIMSASEKSKYLKNIQDQHAFIEDLERQGHIQKYVGINNDGKHPLIASSRLY